MLIEALADENAQLREALADIAADYVLLKVTAAKLIREASRARVESIQLRRRLDDLRRDHREAA